MCCSLFLLNSYLFTENVLGKTQEKGNSGTLLTNFLVEAGVCLRRSNFSSCENTFQISRYAPEKENKSLCIRHLKRQFIFLPSRPFLYRLYISIAIDCCKSAINVFIFFNIKAKNEKSV